MVLGVCGGYQLMGHFYETPEGEKLPGVGVFDLHTEPRKPDEERLIGNVLVRVRAPETGEVCAAMLKDVGCTYVIVGHSERRTIYREDDALVARKFLAAQTQGLIAPV